MKKAAILDPKTQKILSSGHFRKSLISFQVEKIKGFRIVARKLMYEREHLFLTI